MHTNVVKASFCIIANSPPTPFAIVFSRFYGRWVRKLYTTSTTELSVLDVPLLLIRIITQASSTTLFLNQTREFTLPSPVTFWLIPVLFFLLSNARIPAVAVVTYLSPTIYYISSFGSGVTMLNFFVF
jgi:hypothetical protein